MRRIAEQGKSETKERLREFKLERKYEQSLWPQDHNDPLYKVKEYPFECECWAYVRNCDRPDGVPPRRLHRVCITWKYPAGSDTVYKVEEAGELLDICQGRILAGNWLLPKNLPKNQWPSKKVFADKQRERRLSHSGVEFWKMGPHTDTLYYMRGKDTLGFVERGDVDREIATGRVNIRQGDGTFSRPVVYEGRDARKAMSIVEDAVLFLEDNEIKWVNTDPGITSSLLVNGEMFGFVEFGGIEWKGYLDHKVIYSGRKDRAVSWVEAATNGKLLENFIEERGLAEIVEKANELRRDASEEDKQLIEEAREDLKISLETTYRTAAENFDGLRETLDSFQERPDFLWKHVDEKVEGLFSEKCESCNTRRDLNGRVYTHDGIVYGELSEKVQFVEPVSLSGNRHEISLQAKKAVEEAYLEEQECSTNQE